ncbi:PREDICTED: uncharacterized protein LOC106819496 [Priapulus caudatus]|uniref:Uncharacterized protein LOC106819496 n=1 Tax=Priapulus caudatus TaxID=37621 RepID=A0ABM1F582_PRICU|nr:PREDICTED: uncharacterized protein LOC106819496 [Priapulus caudatus]
MASCYECAFLLCVGLPLLSASQSHMQLKRNTEYNDKDVPERRITSLQVRSALACGFYCLDAEYCKSYGYVSAAGNCVLMHGTERQDNTATTFLAVPGLEYYSSKEESPAKCVYPGKPTDRVMLGTAASIIPAANVTCSVYKPPPEIFDLPREVTDGRINVGIGDFNSHNVTWEYAETDEDGALVESWSDVNQLSLIHDAKLPCSFNSSRWRRGYNHDLYIEPLVVWPYWDADYGVPGCSQGVDEQPGQQSLLVLVVL